MTPWSKRSRCRRATATRWCAPIRPTRSSPGTPVSGIDRSSQLVVVHVVSRRRTRAMKEKFYELLASNLADRCGVDPADLIVSITENGDEDWSFGHGRAQFLTGELK